MLQETTSTPRLHVCIGGRARIGLAMLAMLGREKRVMAIRKKPHLHWESYGS